MKTEDAFARLAVVEDYDPGGGEGPGPCVHTFAMSAIGPLGAHWRIKDVRALIEEHGVEEADPPLMGHGLLTRRPDRGPLYFETVSGEAA